MKTTIEVTDRREADVIKTALDDPITRAFVVIVGTLLPLDERERRRVINFVTDNLDIDPSLPL